MAIVAAIVVTAVAWTLFHTISAEALLAPSQGENGGHGRWLLSLDIGALVVALALSQGLLVIAVWRSRRQELRRREADALGERLRRQIAESQSTEESLRTSCRELEDRMAKGMSDFAWASQRLVEVQDNEARRIAHELHGDVGQALAATRLGLHAIQRGSPPPETVTNCIRSIQHVIDVVRDVTVSLRPPVLDDLGLVPPLRWHIERLRQSSDFEIDLRAPEPKDRLPREVENAGFRIVQEALNNISEHACAARRGRAQAGRTRRHPQHPRRWRGLRCRGGGTGGEAARQPRPHWNARTGPPCGRRSRDRKPARPDGSARPLSFRQHGAAVSAIRILLADDHTLVRQGLRSLLEEIDDFDVVAEATDGREALTRAEACCPDVIVMDISMRGLNGLDATERLTQQGEKARVLILSMHSNEEYVLRTLRAGAAGYLLKDAIAEELELAVRAVARGDLYLGPTISNAVVQRYLASAEEIATPHDVLTARQREVLQLLAEGNNTKDIAHVMKVSTKTVESHRAQLMDQLGIRDVPGLVRYAIRTGLVSA